MKRKSGKKGSKKVSAETFDLMFDRGDDVSSYLDLEKATVVERVNVDFPSWMVALGRSSIATISPG